MKISPNDDRQYRTVTLTNGLIVTLVSDPTTDKAAASLDVNVGHFADPDNVPGIAHFLEHMLFLGTEDFPDENHYTQKLQEYGGSSNAYTSCENTNYYFDVLQPHLGEMLNIFSAFFFNPLFTPAMTARELKAVNSENGKNLLNDMWRSFQLQKSTADADHPFSKFGTGNQTTLETTPKEQNIDVRDVLLTFHKTWYSASIMKLCVLGRESLDELEKMVNPLFSRISNNNATKQTYRQGSPYTGDKLPRRLNVVPVKDLRTIEMGWPTHALEHLYRQKPAGYCSHVIGHEGPGSLFALLKKEGLADALSAGMFQNNDGFGMFCISIDATEEGMSRVNDVVNYCYQYIAMFRACGCPEWIYKESQLIADNSFRFKEKSSPMNYVQTISSNMKTYAPEDTLCGGTLYFEYNPDEIKKVMACLTPENMRLQCTSRLYEGQTDLEEQWYKTKYSSLPFPKKQLEEWSSSSIVVDPRFHLPKPNELIAKEFALRCAMPTSSNNGQGVTGIVEGPPPAPTNIDENKLHRLWHKEDSEFGVPKCVIYINVLTPIAYDSPRSTVLAALYTELVKDALNEYSYDASVAGLRYQLINSTRGLQIVFFGYNDVMPTLLTKVTETMLSIAHGSINEERYNLIKDRTVLEYKNFNQDQPYQFAMYNMNYMSRDVRWHNQDKLDAIQEDITIASLQSFAPLLLQRAFCEAMVHGNISNQEAKDLLTHFEKSIGMKELCSGQLARQRCIQFPPSAGGKSHVHRQLGFDPENPESAIQSSYQINPNTFTASSASASSTTTTTTSADTQLKMGAVLAVLSHLMEEPCYDQLRTKEQLGYMVWSGSSKTYGIYSLWFVIQSTERGPAYLDNRIEHFLTLFYNEKLLNMDAETFQSNVQACILTATKKDTSLYAQAGRFWKEIEATSCMFNRKFIAAEVLATVTHADVLSLFENSIKKDGGKRAKVSAHIVGKGHGEVDDPLFAAQQDAGAILVGSDIVSMDAFKSRSALFPPVAPFVAASKAV